MKPSLSKRFEWLQAPIGGFGLLLWFISFQGATWLRDNNYAALADLAAGYVLGFGTAFAGWIAHHLWKGNKSRFIEEHPVFKAVSIFSLFVIGLFGGIGFFIDLYGDTSGWFNTAFWMGVAIMSGFTGPLINEVDSRL